MSLLLGLTIYSEYGALRRVKALYEQVKMQYARTIDITQHCFDQALDLLVSRSSCLPQTRFCLKLQVLLIILHLDHRHLPANLAKSLFIIYR